MEVRVSKELPHGNLSFERIEAWEASYFLATCHHLIGEYFEACSTSYLVATCHYQSGEYFEACFISYSCHISSPKWRVFMKLLMQARTSKTL